MPTTQELQAGFEIVKAIADAVKQLGRAPRGVLYAHLMAHGISMQGYESIERILVNGGLVHLVGDELVWIANTPAVFDWPQ